MSESILREIREIRQGIFKYVLLYILKDEALHGYGIMKKLKDLGINIKVSTLYTTLKKLEDEGLIEVVEERGKIKVYKVTEKGLKTLEDDEVKEMLKKFTVYIDGLKLLKDVGIDEMINTLKEVVKKANELTPEDKALLAEAVSEFLLKVKPILVRK